MSTSTCNRHERVLPQRQEPEMFCTLANDHACTLFMSFGLFSWSWSSRCDRPSPPLQVFIAFLIRLDAALHVGKNIFVDECKSFN